MWRLFSPAHAQMCKPVTQKHTAQRCAVTLLHGKDMTNYLCHLLLLLLLLLLLWLLLSMVVVVMVVQLLLPLLLSVLHVLFLLQLHQAALQGMCCSDKKPLQY
jgi:hypothetical protein